MFLVTNSEFRRQIKYQSKNNQMKKKDRIISEKEKRLRTTSFTFKRQKTIRPTFVWWGWKTA